MSAYDEFKSRLGELDPIDDVAMPALGVTPIGLAAMPYR